MSNEKLRVGIIGIGMYALYNHVPQLRETGRVEVVACARRNPERLAMAQQALQIEHGYTDWRRMLEAEPLDAVVVSTPHHAHVEPTLAALERGCHVLVDKPMALTSAEAWAMVEAAEKANRVLMVSGSRIKGKWQMVKSQIAAGVIGRVQQINWAVSTYRRWFWESEGIPADTFALFDTLGLPRAFYGEWQDWHRDPTQMGGGAFVDLGIYQLDLLLWLAGAPAVDVVAFTKNAGLAVESFVNLQARLTNDGLVTMTFADAVPQSILSVDQHLMIVGDQGVLTDDAEGAIWLHRDHQRRKLEVAVPDTTMSAAFLATILDGQPNLSPAHEAAYTVELMEATYRSANEGKIIHIEQMETQRCG
ncbi:MAG: gfo/Idh/MocA family oxidoreductase [Caldilinea sp. CFX5]|nr:gfo/Idh/MocA family oxidoreductase [Caldilinea sp. CFX5]